MTLDPSEDRQSAWKIKPAEIVVLIPANPSFAPSPHLIWVIS